MKRDLMPLHTKCLEDSERKIDIQVISYKSYIFQVWQIIFVKLGFDSISFYGRNHIEAR